jgi:ATP-dependent exoDNAse (exonuclease V) beta subunit
MTSTLTKLYPVLSSKNPHRRDRHILFFEEGHKYTITTDPHSTYTSVTTWNHSHFSKFDADGVIANMMKGKNWKEGHKYWGLTAEEIKQQWSDNGTSVAASGTNMHYNIECFMNNRELPANFTHKELYEAYKKTEQEEMPLEWKYFIQFVKDTPYLKPYRTEWLIYHEDLKLAGSIDMVYENPDGSLSIYDWKRSKSITRINSFNKFSITRCICHLPDSNFWHYTLQLNTYKTILEEKYGKKIKDLYLVRLHPDTEEKTYELIEVPHLKTEMSDLFLERKTRLL